MRDNVPAKPSVLNQLGILFHPKNLIKTIASQVPLASAGTEMLNQLEGEEVADRLSQTEAQIRQIAEAHAAEKRSSPVSPPLHDWSFAAGEFYRRTVTLAVVYYSGFHARRPRGREMFQPIAHGCIVGPHEVLTCREATEAVNVVAKHREGSAVVLAGFAWYEFEADPIDHASGLCLLRLSRRDEKKWEEAQQLYRKLDFGQLADDSLLPPVRHTVMPWIGQEIGFFHSGEAKDATRDTMAYYHLQFDQSAISHFRRVSEGSLKTFVTCVLPGRILNAGSAVFSRDATLLGIIADTESYPADAGRRAVVRSLLGHPKFTSFAKTKSRST
jgi:hypothetical protein